jgi:hypothetical protein
MVPVTSALASLGKGAEIDATSCAYGPGQLVQGHKTGQYLGDTEAFYALTMVPADMPGGHFRFHAQFPRARWFSYQAYDQTMATQGVVDDLNINPDPSSVNPFLPGQRYRRGHVSYAVDVRNVPPAQRQSPPPPNVLYAGYRMDPSTGGLIQTPSELILFTSELATGPAQQGGVPLPRLDWVVDDPRTNVLQTQAEVCAAMKVAAQPYAPVFQYNAILDKYVWTPIEEPTLTHADPPMVLDPVPQNPPDVSVFRPSSYGYSEPLFNEQEPYIFSGPSALFGRFIVIRFKAPTHPSVERGIPSTGNEQVQYWSWCAGQFESAINITTGCLPDTRAHVDRAGYVTLVVSPPDQRPVIDGKPYPDWLQWSGGGTALFLGEIDPNPRTFSPSPYFMPPTAATDVPYAADLIPGDAYEAQIKAQMGAYYPQVSYCTTQQFEQNRCGT